MKHLLLSAFSTLLAIAPAANACEDASLFARIGGEPVMTRVVDQMVAAMARDPEVAATLDGVDLARFSRKLYIHMCATTGGPCVYAGDDLRKAHEGMNITRSQLDVARAALAGALDANGVGEREKSELARVRASMRTEILSR